MSLIPDRHRCFECDGYLPAAAWNDNSRCNCDPELPHDEHVWRWRAVQDERRWQERERAKIERRGYA